MARDNEAISLCKRLSKYLDPLLRKSLLKMSQHSLIKVAKTGLGSYRGALINGPVFCNNDFHVKSIVFIAPG